MRKIRIVLMLFLLNGSVSVAQPHISELFSLDSTIELKYYTETERQREIIGTVSNETLFFCKNRLLLHDTMALRVFTIDLKTFEQSFFDVKVPAVRDKAIAGNKTLWINGIAVADNRIAIVAQDVVLVYSRARSSNDYLGSFDVENAIGGYFIDEALYFVENINHEKYRLGYFDVSRNRKERACEFHFEEPFLFQFTPNRYFVVSEEAIYKLNMNSIGYEKYSLKGDLLYAVQNENFSPWRRTPDSVTAKIMLQPYGAERIFEALAENREYSYCTKIFPFESNQSLIVYRSYDTLHQIEKYHSLYSLNDSVAHQMRLKAYRFDLEDNEVLCVGKYPFYLYKKEVVFATTYKNRFVQIIQTAPVSWKNKLYKDYKEDVNQYFKENAQIIQLRVMTLKGGRAAYYGKSAQEKQQGQRGFERQYEDYDGQIVKLDSIVETKLILIENTSLQCSSCEGSLYNCIGSILDGNKDAFDYKLAVAFPATNDFLIKKDRINNAKQYLKTEFMLLFVSDTDVENMDMMRSAYSDYPKVIMYDKRKKVVSTFNSREIFEENTVINVVTDKFKEVMRNFLLE